MTAQGKQDIGDEAAVIREALAFQRSVIQSGEAWTETCAVVESEAYDALAALEARLAEVERALREIEAYAVSCVPLVEPDTKAEVIVRRVIQRIAALPPESETR